jgi:general stress protein 26
MEHQVKDFLKSLMPRLCVLSTVTADNNSECAVMAYAIHDDLTLTISTHSSTRKWNNLQKNPSVALTMGWEFGKLNIQYEGKATLIEKGSDHLLHEEVYYSQHPNLRIYHSDSTVFIKITPTWIRVTDMTVQPPKITEKSFNAE